MLIRTTSTRKGAVLLVVLAMLALFAVIGLSFVFYAESRATAARIYREAQDINAIPEPPDPSVAALNAFAQLIYDAPDGTAGAGTFSSLRGHSLARAMYGQYYEGQPTNPNPSVPAPAFSRLTLNSLPYNGVGRVPTHVLGGREIVNYTWFTRQPGQQTFVPDPIFDPERTGNRTRPTDNFNAATRFIGKNVSSTYPDLNDMAIAQVNPVTGQVLMPSFHRTYHFNQATANDPNEWVRQRSLAPPTVVGANTDWTNAQGKYFTGRPRPAEHCLTPNTSTFPYPPKNADDTYTGDVQNLKGSVYPFLRANGTVAVDASNNPILIPKNDSVWVDTGAPVQIWNGKRIKPLFAFLVMPTNNKVNINASGNTRGTFAATGGAYNHDSGMGFNASEINPQRVMRNNPLLEQEYKRLKFAQFGQAQGNFPAVSAGANQPSPLTSNVVGFPGQFAPRVESPIDWDGGAPVRAMRMLLPGQQGTTFGPGMNTTLSQSAYALAPRWVAPLGFSRYGNGETVETTNNPYLWNSYLWTSSGTAGVQYTATDLRKMHQKWADDVGATNETLIGQMSPISLGAMRGVTGLSSSPSRNPANAHRFNLTTRSNGVALHAMMPQNVSIASAAPFAVPYAWPATTPVPLANGANQIPDPVANQNEYNTFSPVSGLISSDFDFVNGTANVIMRGGKVGNLSPIDLNRTLTDYRHPLAVKYGLVLRPDNVILPTAATYATWFQQQMGVAPTPAQAAADAPLLAINAAGQYANLFRAIQDRQEFARDIFARLVVATGAPAQYVAGHGYCIPFMSPPPGSPTLHTPAETAGYDALRYLAQLAANIVDYIDGDDVATTFVWNPVSPNVPNAANLAGAPPHLDPANLFVGPVGGPYVQSDRFVMGSEKPKLVVNEAYAEMTNNPADAGQPSASQAMELRFTLELMNPGATDAAYGNVSSPANPNTNAVLFYNEGQQTQIVGGPVPVPYSAYEIEIHQNGNASLAPLAQRANTLGLTAAPTGRVDFGEAYKYARAMPAGGFASPFDPAMNPVRANGYINEALRIAGNHFPQEVGPVGTRFAPDVWASPAQNPVNQGYLVLVPGGIPAASVEYHPTNFTPAVPTNPMMMNPGSPPTAAAASPGSPFEYAVGIQAIGAPALQIPLGGGALSEAQITGQLTTINANPPAVVLRRLANPYFPPNDPVLGAAGYNPAFPLNPYILVDTLTNVRVNDAVRVGQDSATPPGPHQRPNTLPPPIESRTAEVKRHPMAGLTKICQLDTPPSGLPAETFFRHNSSHLADPETPTAISGLAARNPVPADQNLIQHPQGGNRNGFDWMVHLDRPLVNQLELLDVPAVPSHLLTARFMIQAGPTIHRNQHLAAWVQRNYGGSIVNPFTTRLSRAFELLQVKPWTHATPIGGRVAGKINVNLITDPNVFLALADPQSGDFFKAYTTDPDPTPGYAFNALVNPANPYDPSTTFGLMMLLRHVTVQTTTQFDPVTGTQSQVRIPAAGDRPLRSYGNAATAAGGVLPASNGIGQTPLGSMFELTNQPTDYAKQQLLRKIQNNLTTTSECFEVYMTVGFFEVLNAGPYYVDIGGGIYNAPILGKEIFKNAPGDLRSRYFAVIDRTNLTVDRANPNLQGEKPYYLELAAPMTPINPLLDPRSPAAIVAPWYMDVSHVSLNTGTELIANYDEAPGKTGSMRIRPGQYLRVGLGDHEEWVLVQQIVPTSGANPNPNPVTGVGRIVVTRNTGRPAPVPNPNNVAPHNPIPIGAGANQFTFLPDHRFGTLVTNAQQGNPGPQPAFDPGKPQYEAVMPYFQKLE